MKKRLLPLISILCAFLFTWLFLDNGLGVNIAIFTVLLAGILLINTGVRQRKPVFWFFLTNTLLLSGAIAWHGNYFTIAVFFLNLVFWAGATALRPLNISLPFFQEGLFQIPLGQSRFFREAGMAMRVKGPVSGWKYYFIYGFPGLALVVLFIFFYRRSNVIFDSYAQQASMFFVDITRNWSMRGIGTFLFGLGLVNIFLFAITRSAPVKAWLKRSRIFTRIRGRRAWGSSVLVTRGLSRGLKFEYMSGLVLIGLLNILLLVLNLSDLRLVWFGFEWKGQLLKEFVHEGTGYLIISICISAFTILFYFRGNMQFYSQVKPLKILVNIWLIQNGFLALSVLVRNMRYIDYYGLAYLRIGVFFFLAMALALLFFVFLKIQKQEAMHYFMHRNVLAAMGLLTLCATIDWSMVITKHNLANYKKSFVHMEFLAHMPDRCLPELAKYRGRYKEIGQTQRKLGFGYTDTIDEGHALPFLEGRIVEFVDDYKLRSWQECTLADSRAYRALAPGGRRPRFDNF